jgi:hypothetical protein
MSAPFIRPSWQFMINFLSTVALVKLAHTASTRRDLAALCRQQLQQAEQLGVSNQATLFYWVLTFSACTRIALQTSTDCLLRMQSICQISTIKPGSPGFFVASGTGLRPVSFAKLGVP